MFSWTYLTILFVLFATQCWGQTTVVDTIVMDDCYAKALPYTTDSTKRRQDFDSVANSLVGEWQLVEISGNWQLPTQPTRPTKMKIAQSRQGIIYEDNISVTTFDLLLFVEYGYVRFKVSHLKGKQFFSLPTDIRRGFRLCGSRLIMHDFYGDGQGLAFERINQPYAK